MKAYVIDHLVLGRLDNGDTLSIVASGQMHSELKRTLETITFVKQRIASDFVMSRSESTKAEMSVISVNFLNWLELDE